MQYEKTRPNCQFISVTSTVEGWKAWTQFSQIGLLHFQLYAAGLGSRGFLPGALDPDPLGVIPGPNLLVLALLGPGNPDGNLLLDDIHLLLLLGTLPIVPESLLDELAELLLHEFTRGPQRLWLHLMFLLKKCKVVILLWFSEQDRIFSGQEMKLPCKVHEIHKLSRFLLSEVKDGGPPHAAAGSTAPS